MGIYAGNTIMNIMSIMAESNLEMYSAEWLAEAKKLAVKLAEQIKDELLSFNHYDEPAHPEVSFIDRPDGVCIVAKNHLGNDIAADIAINAYNRFKPEVLDKRHDETSRFARYQKCETFEPDVDIINSVALHFHMVGSLQIDADEHAVSDRFRAEAEALMEKNDIKKGRYKITYHVENRDQHIWTLKILDVDKWVVSQNATCNGRPYVVGNDGNIINGTLEELVNLLFAERGGKRKQEPVDLDGDDFLPLKYDVLEGL